MKALDVWAASVTLEASLDSSPSFKMVTVWPCDNSFLARYRPKGECPKGESKKSIFAKTVQWY